VGANGHLVGAAWGEAKTQDSYSVTYDLDQDGNVYVADRNNHRVQKLGATGQPLAQWGALGAGLLGMWVARRIAP